ncbi:MAG: aromatic hydrocarbon degradation protein [Sulfurimonas sp.]|nr:MAG: aromatic hydrocarbon degradation protein [Sulfurimonas sp.]
MAGGYKIPETSLNAVALGAANVAHSTRADAAYYNPANMIFMENKNIMELDLMYIGLENLNFKGTVSSTGLTPLDINGEKENFLIPTLHYVSPLIDGARFGLSIVAPAGLSKRWNSAPAVFTAKDFSLKLVEVNPSIALPVGDDFAVALGIRMVYTDGIVNSASPISSRDMTGDSIDFGYNLALSYKPSKELEFAIIYKSNIDLTVNGNADLTLNHPTFGLREPYIGDATVAVPLPALLNVAVAYTFATKTTVEFVYEINYWSSYKDLDFDYQGSIDPVINAAFGAVIAKNWKDTNVYRFGITQKLKKFTFMAGLVIDETPAPQSTVGFELPNSDSISVSLGARYQLNEKINIGLSALYSKRDDRTINNSELSGEFSNADILIISAALEYRF